MSTAPISDRQDLSADFNSSGKDFYAFYFEKDSIRGYFDDAARSYGRHF